MTRPELSEQIFRKGYNCAQSVLLTFLDDVNLPHEQAMLITSPFGAGIGQTRYICGAVSAMAMLLGLKKGYIAPQDSAQKKLLYQLTREAVYEFEKEFGSVMCYELLHLKKGEVLEEPKVRTEQYYQERPCIKIIQKTVQITEKYFF